MVSAMSVLSLGSGKMALNTWRLFHSGRISCDLVVSPVEHSHGTCNIQAQNTNVIGMKGIFPWETGITGHMS
jgi:hypothetical protein